VSCLLDTNIVSEWAKPEPDARLRRWSEQADENLLFLSSVSLAEIRFGIDLLPAGRRRRRLADWLEGYLPRLFEGRLLDVTPAVADRAGRLGAHCRLRGRPMDKSDALIAATAQVHGLTLVTRNVGDFALAGVGLLNPFG